MTRHDKGDESFSDGGCLRIPVAVDTYLSAVIWVQTHGLGVRYPRVYEIYISPVYACVSRNLVVHVAPADASDARVVGDIVSKLARVIVIRQVSSRHSHPNTEIGII